MAINILVLYLILLLTAIQTYTQSTPISRYYLLSRDIAVYKHHEKMLAKQCISKSMDPMFVIFTDAEGGGGYHIQRVHRFGYTPHHKPHMVDGDDASVVNENSERVLSFSEIDEQFVEQDFTISHNNICPSLSDFNTTAIKVCPTRMILDVDVNRRPIALYQVQCKCLHCLTPWFDYRRSRRCTPLFKFFKILRVVGRRSSGRPLYSLVWEPMSYACACTKRRRGRTRYVSPP